MGFFSSIFKGAGRIIGSVVETVGKVTGNRTIENWGADLKSLCSFGSSHWNSSASVEKTVDTHRELEKVKNSVEPQAAAAEDEMIAECTLQIKDTLEAILPIISNMELRLLHDNFARQIHGELSDRIMTYINPRLSMDDRRCTQVLSILDDGKRMAACRDYQNSVLTDAVKSFKKDCIRVKDGYLRRIIELAETGLREQEQECKKMEQLLVDRLEDKMDETQIDMERARILIDIEKYAMLQAINNHTYPVHSN